MMRWTGAQRDALVREAAEHFSTDSSCRRICRALDIPEEQIAFSPVMLDTWSDVVKYAVAKEKIEALYERLREEAPDLKVDVPQRFERLAVILEGRNNVTLEQFIGERSDALSVIMFVPRWSQFYDGQVAVCESALLGDRGVRIGRVEPDTATCVGLWVNGIEAFPTQHFYRGSRRVRVHTGAISRDALTSIVTSLSTKGP